MEVPTWKQRLESDPMIPKENDQRVYHCYRMLPPGTSQYFFTEKDMPYYDYEKLMVFCVLYCKGNEDVVHVIDSPTRGPNWPSPTLIWLSAFLATREQLCFHSETER